MTTPRILICGEAFGEHEAHLGHPFVGPSGRELARMLIDAGVLPPETVPYDPPGVRDFWLRQSTVTLTNVFNFRPENNDVETLCTNAAGDRIVGPAIRSPGRYLKREYQAQLERLAGEITSLAPNIVIALGGTASWALLGDGGISRVRGAVAVSPGVTGTSHEDNLRSRLKNLGQAGTAVGVGGTGEDTAFNEVGASMGVSGVVQGKLPKNNLVAIESGAASLVGLRDANVARPIKVLPTYHPTAVLRDWSLRHVTVLDLAKAGREATFPEVRRPSRTIHLEPSLLDIEWYWHEHLAHSSLIACDIETQGLHITCVGFAASADSALVIPFRNQHDPSGSYWRTAEEETKAWGWIKLICEHPIPKLFQNGMYDCHYLWKQAGIRARVDEDTMLLHHALQPEAKKGLGYLGSCYTNEASWKLLNAQKNSLKKDD